MGIVSSENERLEIRIPLVTPENYAHTHTELLDIPYVDQWLHKWTPLNDRQYHCFMNWQPSAMFILHDWLCRHFIRGSTYFELVGFVLSNHSPLPSGKWVSRFKLSLLSYNDINYIILSWVHYRNLCDTQLFVKPCERSVAGRLTHTDFNIRPIAVEPDCKRTPTTLSLTAHWSLWQAKICGVPLFHVLVVLL